MNPSMPGRAVLRVAALAVDGSACGDAQIAGILLERRRALRAALPNALAEIRALRERAASTQEIRESFQRLRRSTTASLTNVVGTGDVLLDMVPLQKASATGQALTEALQVDQDGALTAAMLLDRLERRLTSLQSRLG